MSDNKELLLLSNLSPGDDKAFLERLQGCINYRNSHGANCTKALAGYSGSQIKQVVVGPAHIAFLFSDHKVGRLSFKSVEVKLPSVVEKSAIGNNPPLPPSNMPPGSIINQNPDVVNPPPANSATSVQNANAATYAAVANRSAKIRRVMMATRRAGQFATRGGVIVDRGRQMIPAASIPEDLIAQAQVVLQGKSREVIVRELQRTNLNVNEAVNNLLSREDDDEDMDEGAEGYLPEELLSLLDAGLRSSEGIMEPDALYGGEGYEYLLSRDLNAARRRDGRPEVTRANRPPENVNCVRERFEYGDEIDFWLANKEQSFPPNVKKFVKIAAFQGELLALTDSGLLYGWKWNEKWGELIPHSINTAYFSHSRTDRFVDIETSAYRAIVLTANKKVGTFVDAEALGAKVADTLFMPLLDVPENEVVESIHVCPMFAAFRTKNAVYWWGLNPFNERRKTFEKTKTKAKKYQTNSVSDIRVGSEVRTKSNPVYAANSVAVNLSSATPMIGVMMESAWTLTETCRFRIYTPEQYDKMIFEKQKADKRAINLSVRKRAAPSDDPQPGSSTSIPIKETAWAIKDVFFIYEEPCNDTGIVQIIDGPICGIHFKSYIDETKKGDVSEAISKLRLIRKDELVAVQGGSRQPCSPCTFERGLQRVVYPHGIRRVISTVVDNSGFRMLVEKKGRVHLQRMSTLGKLSSDHVLPVSYSAICGTHETENTRTAKLFNYGDDNILILQDHNGALSPLVRNAAGGFSDPLYLGIAGISHLAVGLRYLTPGGEYSAVVSSAPIERLNKPEVLKSGNKLLFMAALIAPSPNEVNPNLPSLIQLVLYCDIDGVAMFLKTLDVLKKEMDEESFDALVDEFIVNARADGNRSILHVAVMNAFAKTNALQNQQNAIEKAAEGLDMSEAVAHREKMDRKWEEMVAGGGVIPQTGDVDMKDDYLGDPSSPSIMAKVELSLEYRTGVPISEPKARQSNSIGILKIFMENEVIQSRFSSLLHVRDVNGHTPFISAVQHRAYEAASVIWEAMVKKYQVLSAEDFTTQVYNPLIHNDDSPLFIVCYNDTCSFTWTGDEHINQDIFECKTCGLTGSLCCCTECANTCHRNHDCKLKRTSPTAYCDCWEKCGCKALVAGNEVKREYLLRELLDKTNLICQQNMKGEHLLLFLARTVGRQLIEQDNYGRRARNRASANQAGQGHENYPERDLEPPKFADKALKLCLGSWSAIKSLISVGMKKRSENVIITEELFHLGAQNGSTHLDKFIFILLNKCLESHLDMFLNTLIAAASKTGDERDPDVDDYISRFIRSIIRVFTLVTLIAPSTLSLTIQSAAINADDDSQFKYSTSAGEVIKVAPTRTAVAISGVISLVRSIPIMSERNKDKKRNVNIFAQKCRRVFQALPSYAVTELLNTADAYMGPVRTGFINPTLNISRAMHSTDALEYIEKFMNGEQDLSSMLDANGDFKANRRRRYGSRRDTDEDVVHTNENNTQAGNETDDSESDSENEAVSRRFSSQGSLHGHNTASLNNIVETYRRNEPEAIQNVVVARQANATGVDRVEYSTDSVTSASEDEENEDSSDEDESENERNFGVVDPFNNEDFEDDEEMRDNDEEEEDYYDDDGDEEAVNEFAEDVDNDHDDDDGEEVDRLEHNIPVVEIQPADSVPDQEEGEILGNDMEVENVASAENVNPEEAVEINDEELAREIQNEGVSVSIAPESEAVGIAVSNEAPDVARTRSRVIQTSTSSNGSRTRSLTWAVPGEFHANRRDGNGNELVIRTSTISGNEAGNNEQNATRAKPSSSTTIVDDAHASNEKTAFQFAAVFAALIKLVDDLLLQLTRPARSHDKTIDAAFPTPLTTDIEIVKMLRDHVDQKLASTWQWLTVVLDKVEAQLKFGSALNASAVSSNESSEKKVEKEKKFKAKDQPTAVVQKKESPHGRREFLQYFFSVARAHAGENGDELPIIEYRALRTAAFVAEAFLFHAGVLELIDDRIRYDLAIHRSKKLIDGSAPLPFFQHVTYIPAKTIKQFYQRSNSICYPCISYCDPHNVFQYSVEECLPLAVRPQLLQPDAEKNSLFGLPVPQRQMAEHLSAAESHGITNPTFHSLADLPTSFSELKRLLAVGMTDSSVPRRSLMKTYMADEPIDNHGLITVDDVFAAETSASRVPLQRLLGRWSNAFSLITQMHTDDLVHYCGGDPTFSVILVETAGFHFRQAQFRKRIEKLKNGQSRDLIFTGMHREKSTLIVQTFRMMNQQYVRRITNGNGGSNSSSIVLKMYTRGIDINGTPSPPLASHKVKVTFKDEPGEGTGVARSFYSAVAEALTLIPNMPLDGFEPEDDKKKTAHPNAQSGSGATTPKRLARGALQAIQVSITRRVSTRKRQELSTKVEPYYPPQQSSVSETKAESRAALASNRALAGERLFAKVHACEPVFANKVTGMLLELPINDILNMITCEDTMKAYLVEAIKLLQSEGYINSIDKETDAGGLREDAPFFTRIESNGHFIPIPATCSENRLNGFRNVGRMIGICLQQREIFPIQFARHVLKFILGKPLNWFDLAFFDPVLFDSMRSLVFNGTTGQAQTKDFYEMLGLTYTVSYSDKEGGKSVDLKPGGGNIPVTLKDVLEYFYLFVENRLLGPAIPVLEAIKKGVFDVIPADCLNHLTPEDLRLILCGSPEINISLLESYTKILDESSSTTDILEKYKQTFWSVISKFSDQEKQDLIFFWTGSPTLPATEEEFQPLPTIMVRPSDNNMHLPTANTCISRLYLPLYSSKRVLRAKLLMAIKSRNFGFV